jgi:hypothetical protein
MNAAFAAGHPEALLAPASLPGSSHAARPLASTHRFHQDRSAKQQRDETIVE